MQKQEVNNAKNTQCDYNYNLSGQDWADDAHGAEQSPIDIISAQSLNSSNNMSMEFTLCDHPINGLQVNDSGNALLVNGPFSKLRATDLNGDLYEFEAMQFHFHAPAEHTINGGRYELELHIVHRMTAESAARAKTHRKLAVVAVFFELDKDPKAENNPFIEALKLDHAGEIFDLNMHKLLGEQLRNMMSYYAYKGSLTTPPCSEAVNWYLFETPLKINKTQLNQFDMRWRCNTEFAGGHGNNRAIQAINGRSVMKSQNCCVMASSEEKITPAVEEIIQTPTNSDLSTRRKIMFERLSFNRSAAGKFEDSNSPNRRSGSACSRVIKDRMAHLENGARQGSSTPTLSSSTLRRSNYPNASSFMVEKESRFSKFAAEQLTAL